jgi:hypothetical protein
MILKLFKQSYFAQIALLIGLAFIIWLPAFIKPHPIIISNSNVFTNFMFSTNLFNIPLFGVIIAFLLLLTEAFLLAHTFSKHQLTHSNSFLTGFLFVLFLSRTPEHLGFHPALIALLLLILGLQKLLDNFKSLHNYNLLLSTSILFSLASLFIPSIILLFPVIWISLILFQSFNWRSIPISLIGLLTPYFFICAAYFWFDNGLLFLEQIENLTNTLLKLPEIPNGIEITELIVSAVLLVLASYYILPRIGNQVISIRKKTSFMFWFLGFSIIISFFSSDALSREIVFIPFAAILGFYFSAVKRQFWADIFISLIFLLILFQNYRILWNA